MNDEKPWEIYFYISVQTQDNWMDHFEYIGSCKYGLSVCRHNLDTGEKKKY